LFLKGVNIIQRFHRELEWTGRKSEGVSKGANEGVNEGLNKGLSEGLKSLLTAIKDNPGIKAKDLNVVLERRPIKTIDRQIKVLVHNNLIERRGSRKTGGYYFVNKKR